MKARTTTAAPAVRPTIAEMRAALAQAQPTPVGSSSEPMAIVVGRVASSVPKFFGDVVTSYRFHRTFGG